jgi:hypothetical protein
VTRTQRKKRVGRPPTGKGLLVGVRLQPDLVELLDTWRTRQPRPMSRPAALRDLAAMKLLGGNR